VSGNAEGVPKSDNVFTVTEILTQIVVLQVSSALT